MYMHNFDPKKSKNPFAYFTQIIHFVFLRRIREQQHVYNSKYKYIETIFNPSTTTIDEDDSGTGMKAAYGLLGEMFTMEFHSAYEEKLARPEEKKETPILDFEDDDVDICT